MKCRGCDVDKNALTENGDGVTPFTEFCLLCGESGTMRRCNKCNNAMCQDCWNGTPAIHRASAP